MTRFLVIIIFIRNSLKKQLKEITLHFYRNLNIENNDSFLRILMSHSVTIMNTHLTFCWIYLFHQMILQEAFPKIVRNRSIRGVDIAILTKASGAFDRPGSMGGRRSQRRGRVVSDTRALLIRLTRHSLPGKSALKFQSRDLFL